MMKIQGGCFCGALRYEADINPKMIGICHCRDCQLFSGSAFRTATGVPLEHFQFTKGEPNFFDKTADSGLVRRMAFCGTCGSHICSYSDASEDAPFISLRAATADNFEDLVPSFEFFCDSKVAWLPDLEKAFKFPRMP